LAFHPQPQVIRIFFNRLRFGPPVDVTQPSTCPWLDHSVSGLRPATISPYSDSVSLRLPYSVKLATKRKSLTHYTKGTPSQNKSAPTACTHRVSGSISLPSPGFFSPFPHGTGSLSVNWEYLALEDGPPVFSQNSTCSDLLNACQKCFRIRDYHPLWSTFPGRSSNTNNIGWSPFARRYLGNLY
jgi:hypothetical protein